MFLTGSFSLGSFLAGSFSLVFGSSPKLWLVKDKAPPIRRIAAQPNAALSRIRIEARFRIRFSPCFLIRRPGRNESFLLAPTRLTLGPSIFHLEPRRTNLTAIQRRQAQCEQELTNL